MPLHCASYCFLNSPGTSRSSAPSSCATARAIRDEGRGPRRTRSCGASSRSAPGTRRMCIPSTTSKTATSSRPAPRGRREEPWTWVRTQGKGRVFYTAYGHDGRTWQNPGFHDLVERGIRWAANKGPVFDSRSRVPAGLPAFTYEESPAESQLPARPEWGTQGEPIRTDAAPALARGVDASTWSSPAGSSPGCSPPSPRSPSPSAWPGTTAAGSGSPRPSTTPTPSTPARPGPRPDQDLRGHRRRRQGRQVHRLRREAQHPHEPRLPRRRRDRPPGARYALPQGHRRRRQGRRRARSSSPAGARRHARRAEQPALGASTTGSGGSSATRGSAARSAASGSVRPGVLPVQARRIEARVPPEHQQQLLGRRLQRRGPGLRLDGQRLPERLPADPQPLLRGGARLVAAGAARTSPLEPISTRSPTRSGRSTGTAGSPPRPATRSTPRGPIRRILEPDGVRRRADRPPRRDVHAPAQGKRLRRITTAGTCWPATTNGPRRSRRRSAPTATSG